MKYFYTFVTETLTRPVVVKAKDQEEAEQKVIDAYYNGKFVLDAADFVDVNFETREGDLAKRLSPADQLNLTYVE
nr:MAG TPA: DpnD/PcfM-like protein [Caudoviricetes sp.]